jgi:hypothetical protein
VLFIRLRKQFIIFCEQEFVKSTHLLIKGRTVSIPTRVFSLPAAGLNPRTWHGSDNRQERPV